jgi:hypothetical protein
MRRIIVALTVFGVFVTISAKAQSDYPRFELFGGFSLIRPSVPDKLGKNPSNSAFLQSAAYSERCRSPFRGDGDRDSELMPITIPR